MLSNNAVGTILRLLNLGIPAYWLATTLAGIVYQQLVRRVCDSCKEEYTPTEQEHFTFMTTVAGQPKFYRGKGCARCQSTGYRGRTAIHEILIVNDQMRDLIYQQAGILKLKEAARASGFENIFQDAIKKVASGQTTIAEFSRALG